MSITEQACFLNRGSDDHFAVGNLDSGMMQCQKEWCNHEDQQSQDGSK